MALKFPIYPPTRYQGQNEPVKRPKEFACFSYDNAHRYQLGDSSMKWYYPPDIGTFLGDGFDKFDKHDDGVDEHLDSLLKTIASHEQGSGEPIDAHIVTWRGMLTKIMATPFNDEEFEMNATLYRDCIFIEEHHDFKVQKVRRENQRTGGRHKFSQPMMQYWGYKFETLSTLPRPWAETPREYIENRNEEIVSNKEQYCSVVRTGFGKTTVCLGGEVDAIWDAKPATPGAPINWVELKTSAEICSQNDQFVFDRKLMKFWIQSFLLGVPKIIVGFRDREGILRNVQEFSTISIPYDVQRRGMAKWDGNVCIRFTSLFLDWLRVNVNDEGVWRIKRARGADFIEVFRVEEAGHGNIITDEFMNWRIKLDLSKSKPPDPRLPAAQEPAPEQQQQQQQPTPEPASAPGV